ncbi:uncharacterized protein [Panulirus ornatus]|uniref:uncharacterized protein isoform X1 n=1 Tax=Panulirus ornatus TaxID=150431 RepID=UPI003A8C2776
MNPGTSKERRRELLVLWVMRKYVKFLVLGALSSCALLNLALHAGAGLQYYCQDECLINLLKGPVRSLDRQAIGYIRKYWVDAPAPQGTYKPDFPLDNPPWSTMGSWGAAYKFVNDFFRDHKEPGTFMEIGASDGEFKSLTLFLEQRLGFRGLLVEPHPDQYRKLRAVGRSSYSINACATPGQGHRKDLLWIRHTPKNLPHILSRVQRGGSHLLQYVLVENVTRLALMMWSGPPSGAGPGKNGARAVLQRRGPGCGRPGHHTPRPRDHLHAGRGAGRPRLHPYDRSDQDVGVDDAAGGAEHRAGGGVGKAGFSLCLHRSQHQYLHT